jgi:CheY-like chemotaxis protein
MKISPQHVPLNILLADDDMDDRLFFEKALNEIPIDTKLISFNNGELLMDYLAAHSEHLPDILFLDLSMPRKTGFECLAEIKENEELATLPVVLFTTSFTRGADLEENLINMLSRMGAQDYIRKPGDFEQLKQVIHQTLTGVIEKKRLVEKENYS